MAKLALLGGPKAAEGLKGRDWRKLHPDDEAAVVKALRDNYWGGFSDDKSPNAVFEREFAAYKNARYGLVVANGTVSLELCLRAGGVQPGDEVIVPAITFIASASAVVSVGAVPVFVDVEPATAQLSAQAMERAITARTKAVIVVHYGGYFADLDAILPIARKHGLLVIEDCAHAQGSFWKGKGAGSWGDFGSFSFQNSKSLAAGEGGIVLTNDEKLYERASVLRNIGRRTGQTTYDHWLSASNLRMGGLQGALLLSRFRRFPREAEEYHRNGAFLAAELDKVPGLRRLPSDQRITQRGYYFLIACFDAQAFGCSRKRFLEAMQAEGVTWAYSGYNRPLYHEPAFAADNLRPLLHKSIALPDYPAMRLPNAEKWGNCQVTFLHIYLLGDDAAVRLVLDAVHKVKENAALLARED